MDLHGAWPRCTCKVICAGSRRTPRQHEADLPARGHPDMQDYVDLSGIEIAPFSRNVGSSKDTGAAPPCAISAWGSAMGPVGARRPHKTVGH